MNPLRQFQMWRALDHVLGGKAPATRFEARRLQLQPLSKAPPQPVKQIPALEGLSDHEIRREFMRRGRPVVLKGKAAEWPCVQEWSMAWLKRHYGDDKVDVFDPLDASSSQVNYDVEVTTLSAVLEAMERGDVSKYSRFLDNKRDIGRKVLEFGQKTLIMNRQGNKIQTSKICNFV